MEAEGSTALSEQIQKEDPNLKRASMVDRGAQEETAANQSEAFAMDVHCEDNAKKRSPGAESPDCTVSQKAPRTENLGCSSSGKKHSEFSTDEAKKVSTMFDHNKVCSAFSSLTSCSRYL
jgi:hypothetical protein